MVWGYKFDRVDKINVPGATTSGFIVPSFVGPLLLNVTTSVPEPSVIGSSFMGGDG
jgi:hypothetical protein